jgi:hypothetical protein
MSWKLLAAKLSDTSDSTGLSEQQKTVIIAAWSTLKGTVDEKVEHIFSKYYQKNPKYRALFYSLGEDFMIDHTEDVLQIINDIILNGLRDVQIYEENINKIKDLNKIINRKEVRKMNQVIKLYFFEKTTEEITKTLEDAVDLLMTRIESKFDESAGEKNEKDLLRTNFAFEKKNEKITKVWKSKN